MSEGCDTALWGNASQTPASAVQRELVESKGDQKLSRPVFATEDPLAITTISHAVEHGMSLAFGDANFLGQQRPVYGHEHFARVRLKDDYLVAEPDVGDHQTVNTFKFVNTYHRLIVAAHRYGFGDAEIVAVALR